MIPDIDTTIVGAGPYGLSIAAYLRSLRLPFQLMGTPMESWRNFMPEGMILKSEAFASNLWDPAHRYTLRRYCQRQGLPFRPVGAPVSRTRFLQYADWFCNSAGVASRDVKVERIRRIAGGFALSLADGEHLTSRRVVLATGHMAYRRVPKELQNLPEPLVLHSSRIGDVKDYAGKQVTIVGSGQSALETAALLHEAGACVHIVVRRGPIEWNSPSRLRSLLARLAKPDAGIGAGWRSTAVSELPRLFRLCFAAEKRHRFVSGSYGPSGAWWLRSRVEGRIEVLLNTAIEAVQPHSQGVQLRLATSAGPSRVYADHVIAATGYRVDIDRLELLEPALRANLAVEAAGIPALDAHFETSIAGLFVVGLASAPVFGPIMRFMYGAKHAAPIVASHLVGTLHRGRRPRTTVNAGVPA